FVLSDKTIKLIQIVFAKYPQFNKVVIYGSRAKCNYKNGSDIDLTMYGSDIPHRLLLTLLIELDDLMLPYTIDLSIFSNIDNVNLKEHINKVGKTFYSCNKLDIQHSPPGATL
ncbi:MAG: nucleotidyltransferase domain-containing protein, partial [Neisseriaceae bacterium]